jgi:hypothetical protein
MTGRGLAAVLGLWLGVCAGAEAGWVTIRTEENRFVVNGTNAAEAQDVAVWLESARTRLGRDFAMRTDFNAFQPVVVVLHPEIEAVALRQRGRGRGLVQEIRAPGGTGFEVLEFAEAVVELLVARFVDQQTPADREPVAVPGWLVRGIAGLLVPEAGGRLRADGVAQWQAGDLAVPFLVTRGDGEFSRAESLWAFLFLVDEAGEPGVVWRELLRSGEIPLAWWTRVRGKRSLREVHLAWETWMATEARRFLRHPYGEAVFWEMVERERSIRPGEFGFAGEVPRYGEFTLSDLAERLGEPWVEPVLRAWRTRMTMLRFGQRAERLQVMDLYLGAAEALLEAGGARGARRAAALERFRELVAAAEGGGRQRSAEGKP